jgi:hypothetical protein
VKILVIGDSSDTAATCARMSVAEAARTPAGGVAYYRSAEQALRELERGVHGYGWVLIEGGGAAHATAEAVRAHGGTIPIAVFNHYETASARTRAAPPLCAVETTCDGLQILRCALHRAAQQPDGQRALHEAIDTQPLVFEYHAPCRKMP